MARYYIVREQNGKYQIDQCDSVYTKKYSDGEKVVAFECLTGLGIDDEYEYEEFDVKDINVKDIFTSYKRAEEYKIRLETTCPECGGKLVERKGYSKFLGCSNYPKCHYTRMFPEGWI